MAERTVSATEARVHFGQLLDDVVMRNDIVIVERAGQPKAVIVSVKEWQRYAGSPDDRWGRATALLEEFHDHLRAKHGPAGLGDVDVEEEIRAGREERARQIDDLLR